jgi:hypothetical protein
MKKIKRLELNFLVAAAFAKPRHLTQTVINFNRAAIFTRV